MPAIAPPMMATMRPALWPDWDCWVMVSGAPGGVRECPTRFAPGPSPVLPGTMRRTVRPPAGWLGPPPGATGGEPQAWDPTRGPGPRPGMARPMSNARATRPRLHHLAERLGAATILDGPAEPVAGWVRGIVPKGPVKDTLSGTPLGHALHPFLTDLPIGTWTSASLLDVVGGRAARPASERLIAAGILAAVPTAASGLNDWADTTP